MKKLRLIAMQSQREEILKELMLLGCVEIRVPEEEQLTELPGLQRAGGDSARLRAEQAKLTNALRLLGKYAPAKGGLLTPKPTVSMEKLLDESVLAEDLAAAEHIIELDGKVRRCISDQSRIRSAALSLEPWMNLDMPLETKSTSRCSLFTGTLPPTVTAEQASLALGEAAPEAELVGISEDDKARYMLLVAVKEQSDAALTALRALGWSAVSLGGSGTPAEQTEALANELRASEEAQAGYTEELAGLGSVREALKLGVDTYSTRIAREENAEKLLNTQNTFYFEGWLTAPEEEKLGGVLSAFDCAWETEDADPEHPEEVPIKLSNNSFTSPFNLVTEMYSLPAYNGLDPNPFIAPFFALFFGIMFADMAYGIVLLVAGLLFKYKAKPTGTMKRFSGLMIICGITTFAIGFLTGGFFGDVVTQIGKWFGQEWALVPHFGSITLPGDLGVIDLPLDLLTGNNPLYVLVMAICLGAVHLLLGVGIGMYLKIKDGEWIDAIFNDFSWWIIVAGLLLMVLGKGNTVLWVGVGMMVLGNVLTEKGLGKVTGIVGKVYNGATGYLGDFLSYSRLMALMLAGSVIASVFNQLASLGNANGPTVAGCILFVLVFCIGHVLNFGLNLIGCFVHTLRLQFLEFFGKWYRDGGRAFRPLQVTTKYVNVKEERG